MAVLISNVYIDMFHPSNPWIGTVINATSSSITLADYEILGIYRGSGFKYQGNKSTSPMQSPTTCVNDRKRMHLMFRLRYKKRRAMKKYRPVYFILATNPRLTPSPITLISVTR